MSSPRFMRAFRQLCGAPVMDVCVSGSGAATRHFGVRRFARLKAGTLLRALSLLPAVFFIGQYTSPACGQEAAKQSQQLPPVEVKQHTPKPKAATQSIPHGGPRGTVPANAQQHAKPSGFSGKAEEGYRQSTANLGPLGTRPLIDVPYSVHSVSGDLIKNQGVETFSEMTKYIPSLQQQGHPGLEFGPPVVRGMMADDSSANTRIDGMNVRGDITLPVPLYERYEVLTGPSGALYGFSYPSGTLNGILKRPQDQQFTEVGTGVVSNARPFVWADVNGHFGENDAVGYRINVLHSDGEAYVSTSNLDRELAGIGLDIALSKDTKVEINANRYYFSQMGYPGGFAYGVANGKTVSLPAALDPTLAGYGQSFGGIKAQNDITDAKLLHNFDGNWSLEAGILRQEADRYFVNRITNTLQGDGTYKTAYSSSASESEVISNIVNLNGTVYTGPLKHELAFGTNGFDHSAYSFGKATTYTLGSSLIDSPTEYSTWTPSVWGARYLASETQQQTLVQNDTVHFNEHWSVLLGLSESWLGVSNYNAAGAVTSKYNVDAALSPTVALMYKPWRNVSTYVSYGSSIQQGDTAPTTAANSGQTLAPYRSEQYEAGLKASLAKIDLTSAVFYIERPYATVDIANVFRQLGNQDDLGAEFTAKGKVTDEITVVGGLTWLQTKTTDMVGSYAADNGNQVVGVPEWRANLLTEYAVPEIPGLTPGVNIHYTGKRAANAENSSWADGYITVDLAVRYKTLLMGQEVTWRAAVDNLFDEKYWASINGNMSGQVGVTNTAYLGEPRTFKASMAVKF